MRIDRGKGEHRGHLRVGRVLVDWSVKAHPESPRIDGAADFLTRVDPEKEAQAWREAFAYLCGPGARPMGFDRAVDDFDRVEQWARWALEAGPSRDKPERFDGLQIRWTGRRAIFVGLAGLRSMPNPAQWRPGALYRRARWIAAGRPQAPPSGHDFYGGPPLGAVQASERPDGIHLEGRLTREQAHALVGTSVQRQVNPACERCGTETLRYVDHSGGWNQCPECGWMQQIRHTPGGEPGVLTGWADIKGGYRTEDGGIDALRLVMVDEQARLEAAEAEYMRISRHKDPWPRDAAGAIIPPPGR